MLGPTLLSAVQRKSPVTELLTVMVGEVEWTEESPRRSQVTWAAMVPAGLLTCAGGFASSAEQSTGMAAVASAVL